MKVILTMKKKMKKREKIHQRRGGNNNIRGYFDLQLCTHRVRKLILIAQLHAVCMVLRYPRSY